jgi:hypothetical protein
MILYDAIVPPHRFMTVVAKPGQTDLGASTPSGLIRIFVDYPGRARTATKSPLCSLALGYIILPRWGKQLHGVNTTENE